MRIFMEDRGFCEGIKNAYSRMNSLAGDVGRIQATHRMSDRPSVNEWDPLSLIANGDGELLKRFPNLIKVEIIEDLEQAEQGQVVALGHKGLSPSVVADALTRGVIVNNFRCPHIMRFYTKAILLSKNGYDLIIFGKKDNHHTQYARQLAEESGRMALITEDSQEARERMGDGDGTWVCIAQVTGNVAAWEVFKLHLTESGPPVLWVDTFCSDAKERQNAAGELAHKAGCVVVVNDRGGSTRSVLERAQSVNPRAYLYSPDEEPSPDWLMDDQGIALVGGIHVSEWQMSSIADRLTGAGPKVP